MPRMPSDPLARHWRHEVTVERYAGSGAYGPAWDDPAVVLAAVDDETRMVRDGDGTEVVSSCTVAMPPDTAWIPPGSKITLPGAFGGRSARVITTTVGDGGGMPTPDHLAVHIE